MQSYAHNSIPIVPNQRNRIEIVFAIHEGSYCGQIAQAIHNVQHKQTSVVGEQTGRFTKPLNLIIIKLCDNKWKVGGSTNESKRCLQNGRCKPVTDPTVISTMHNHVSRCLSLAQADGPNSMGGCLIQYIQIDSPQLDNFQRVSDDGTLPSP